MLRFRRRRSRAADLLTLERASDVPADRAEGEEIRALLYPPSRNVEILTDAQARYKRASGSSATVAS